MFDDMYRAACDAKKDREIIGAVQEIKKEKKEGVYHLTELANILQHYHVNGQLSKADEATLQKALDYLEKNQ